MTVRGASDLPSETAQNWRQRRYTKLLVLFACVGFLLFLLNAHFFLSPLKEETPSLSQQPLGDDDEVTRVTQSLCASEDALRVFNNDIFRSRVKSATSKHFFRYYKVQLENECPCFADHDGKCSRPDCAVQECTDAERDAALQKDSFFNVITEGVCHGRDSTLSSIQIDGACPEESILDVDQARADDAGDCADTVVCLTDNPERFTGYHGASAHRVWGAIQAQCDAMLEGADITSSGTTSSGDMGSSSGASASSSAEEGMEAAWALQDGMERLMSGFHTSVSAHLCHDWPDANDGSYGPNLAEFERRFSADSTGGCGPDWLQNLRFAFRATLEALAKGSSLWRQYPFYSGLGDSLDAETRELAVKVADVATAYLKAAPAVESRESLAALVRGQHGVDGNLMDCYDEIANVMDCVGCTKCRLWGKLQVHGIGVVLRLLRAPEMVPSANQALFSDDSSSSRSSSTTDADSASAAAVIPQVNLNQNDIVALFNLVERLSASLQYVHQFEIMAASGEEDSTKRARNFVPLPNEPLKPRRPPSRMPSAATLFPM